MLLDVDQDRRDNVEKDMKAKLQKHVDAYNESQRLLEILQKEKDKWEEKMVEVISKAEKYLQEEVLVEIHVRCPPLPIEDNDEGVKA